MLAGYRHFLSTAASLQWDEAAVPLAEDACEWPSLSEADHEPLLDLLAGFCVGEERVAEELEPFARANAGPIAACFEAQARDEARHARFFDRVAHEVAGVPGTGAAQRRTRLRERLDPRFLELFEVELPAAARRIAEGGGHERGVALYHMVLEGVVFSAGQLALLRRLAALPLPGIAHGVELVLRDERWHIGFGARCLQDRGLRPGVVDALVSEGREAAAAWGPAVPDDVVAHIATLHERRLRAAGLRPTEPAPA